VVSQRSSTYGETQPLTKRIINSMEEEEVEKERDGEE
jgi:hypothetical protein